MDPPSKGREHLQVFVSTSSPPFYPLLPEEGCPKGGVVRRGGRREPDGVVPETNPPQATRPYP